MDLSESVKKLVKLGRFLLLLVLSPMADEKSEGKGGDGVAGRRAGGSISGERGRTTRRVGAATR